MATQPTDSTVTLHGFGLNDRSGKVRWMAHELGLPIDEQRVGIGAHRQAPYTDLNPYGMIPAVQWQGETLIESFAAMTYVAETVAMDQGELGLVVEAGEPDRAAYLQWCALFGQTFETKLVEYLLSRAGRLPAALADLTHDRLTNRMATLRGQLPERGFLVAGRFTLADIQAAYTLRLAISSGLCTREQVASYLDPLIERPAAQESGFFTSLAPA